MCLLIKWSAHIIASPKKNDYYSQACWMCVVWNGVDLTVLICPCWVNRSENRPRTVENGHFEGYHRSSRPNTTATRPWRKPKHFFFPLELRIIKTSLQSPKTQAEHELQQFPLWTILIVPETTDGNSEHKHVNIPVISVYWHRLMFQTAGTVKNRRIWPSTYRKQRYGLLKTWKFANFSS